jgi:hypothetical protein
MTSFVIGGLSMHRLIIVLLLALSVLAPTHAMPNAVRSLQADGCVPETQQCITGRFRQYWEQHGGLPVFGYPITPAENAANADTGQTYLTQWLERNRFEAHTENAAPYDVLLGRLGDVRLRQQGRNWFTFAKAEPSAPHYFSQTGHAIAHAPFWTYWSTHGLEFDGRPGTSEAESLALFGLPLSEPAMETNASGDTVLTQWFERARFEDHGARGVLLGLLGREVTDAARQAPPPPPPPAPPVCEGVPAGTNGTIGPACVHGGDLVTAVGYGFQQGERIAFYVAKPDGTAVEFPVWQGDASPSASGEYHIRGALPRDTAPGIYALMLYGTGSNRTATLPFRIIPLDPNAPVTQDYSLIPEGVNAVSIPTSGPRTTRFSFQTTGFAGERVAVYLTLPDGTVLGAPFQVGTDSSGNVDQRLRLVSDISDPVGIVITTFEGVDTHKKAYAYTRYSK